MSACIKWPTLWLGLQLGSFRRAGGNGSQATVPTAWFTCPIFTLLCAAWFQAEGHCRGLLESAAGLWFYLRFCHQPAVYLR